MSRDLDTIRFNALALLAGSKTCCLGSIDQDGYPAVRAMLAPREHYNMHEFYLTTNTSSRHVAEFKSNPKGSLYFNDATVFHGLLFKGTVEAFDQDRELKERLWRDGDEIYYPLGSSDPDYCVLKFTASLGRWYSDFSTTDFVPAELCD